MACNSFICTILLCLIEYCKITLFIDLVGKIIKVKVAEIDFFLHFSVTQLSQE